jgi:catechol 2,3-dioxygenase-like lactoylglutathione lyase family enzyme
MAVVSQMVRAALQVSDLDQSTDFYKDVLGLDEEFLYGAMPQGGNTHELIGMPSTIEGRVRILKVPGKPAYGMVGLFEIKNPTPPKLTRASEGSNIGEVCMVFYCEDLDEVARKVKARGLPIVGGPVPYRIRGRVKQREMTIRGPDGEKINLIEWNVAKADAGDRPEKWTGNPE